MDGLNEYKPAIAMFLLQFTYAGVSLSTRTALLHGMSPRVFVLYRQAIATLVIAPLAYFSRSKSRECSLGLRSFSLIFFAALIGVTINQNLFFEGLYLASSSMASAMGNLVPAVTFVMAAIFGLEKISLRSLRSIAKILGTMLCVGGALSIALLRGPSLLNAEQLPALNSLFVSGVENWFLGSLFLFANCCCWSVWLILQVPVSACHPDPVSLSAWMCFLATLQSAAVTFLVENDLDAWKLHSTLELACCFYSGIVGSALSFFVQAWCISKRGPLFSAMFNPLCTVIVTILAAIFLHEKIYAGGLAGAIGVIIGLYVLLWGKAEDVLEIKPEIFQKLYNESKLVDDGSMEKTSCKIYLEEPLLSKQTSLNHENWV